MRQRMRTQSTVAQPFPAMKWETGAVSYVSPGAFLVTGRDARLDAYPGAIVFIPGGGWSAVQQAIYSGGNTTVYISDAVCFSGMTAASYATPTINPANLCTGGTPLSGGDLVSWVKANAFDGNALGSNNYSRVWLSSQSTTGVSGVAYIGYQFAAGKKIRWVRISQGNCGLNSGDAGSAITSALLQYSDNGSAWTTHATLALVPEIFHMVVAPIPAAAHAYWRLLANSAPTFNYWGVNELQMGE